MEKETDAFSTRRFVRIFLVFQGTNGEEVFAMTGIPKNGVPEYHFPFGSIEVIEHVIDFSYLIEQLRESLGVNIPADRWQPVAADHVPRSYYGQGWGIVKAVLTAGERDVLENQSLLWRSGFVSFQQALEKAEQEVKTLMQQHRLQ